MAFKPLDSRQSANRAILQQLFPYVGNQTLDVLLASIDSEVTPPLDVTASNPASLVINVGSAIVSNPESNRQKSMNFIGNGIPAFVGATITFPSTSPGNITTSQATSTPLTLPSGDYVAVLLALDDTGTLDIAIGTPVGSIGAVVVPPPDSSTQPFAYVILHNLGGTIQNVAQSEIFQLAGGGGSSGSGGGGIAQEVPLTIGTTSVNVTFPTAKSNTNYVVIAQLTNLTDPNPEYQPITITQKLTTGFQAEWNGNLGTSNYVLSYVVAPGASLQSGEFIVSMGSTSATISFPIAFASTAYVALADFVNLVDGLPQFQPTTITAKTLSSFTVTWNGPVSDGNYRIAWFVGAYQ
jgi:hypothetical protein